MVCPRCGSNNVNYQLVSDVYSKNAHHGILWWCFVGWWWLFFKWIFLTVPALFAKIFIPKKQKVITKQIQMCVCQNCGNSWKA